MRGAITTPALRTVLMPGNAIQRLNKLQGINTVLRPPYGRVNAVMVIAPLITRSRQPPPLRMIMSLHSVS